MTQQNRHSVLDVASLFTDVVHRWQMRLRSDYSVTTALHTDWVGVVVLDSLVVIAWCQRSPESPLTAFCG
ncbi:MAG: hypothetical protein JO125_13350 [Chloroflexi bacterium]|nr:hypothetical protein [Chloroflexota bacterium]